MSCPVLSYFISYRLAACRLSVCLSSVTFVHPTQTVEIFENVSSPFSNLGHPDTSTKKFYGDRPRGTPPSGELNTRGVAIAILDLSKAISRKRCKIGCKLVILTNMNSHMSFLLVPKSVTLNDLERRNDRYFALFHRILSSQVKCIFYELLYLSLIHI